MPVITKTSDIDYKTSLKEIIETLKSMGFSMYNIINACIQNDLNQQQKTKLLEIFGKTIYDSSERVYMEGTIKLNLKMANKVGKPSYQNAITIPKKTMDACSEDSMSCKIYLL
jgi:hypothetical protein